MINANNYQILYRSNSFSVYDDAALLGRIERPICGKWPLRLTIKGIKYKVSSTKRFNRELKIEVHETGKLAAIIRMPRLGLFSNTSYESGDGKLLRWIVKDFLSLHWQWKQNNNLLVDSVEKTAGNRANEKELIALTENNSGEDDLIMTGILLSLLRKSKLSFGTLGI